MFSFRRKAEAAPITESDLVEESIKAYLFDLLVKFTDEVEADSGSGSYYIGVYRAGTVSGSGLGRGLRLITDKSPGIDPAAAFTHKSKSHALAASYGMRMVSAQLVEELSPENLKVSELDWDKRNSPHASYLEYGLSNVPVLDVVMGRYGHTFADAVGLDSGVGLEASFHANRIADYDVLNNFFARLSISQTAYNLQPIMRTSN